MSRTEGGVPLYDAFGERYDLMVDWPARIARESPFFEAIFRQVDARRALDAGCGTGWHAAHFARLGLEVVGADPSAEMIRLARAHGAGQSNPRFLQAGLGELRAAVEGQFDVLTCLGNTLPHLPDEAALAAALADAQDVLRPGGALVIQQLNYDRILAQRQRFLGVNSRTEGGAEHLFFRFYDFPVGGEPGGRLTFNLATFTKPAEGGVWSFRVDSTSLQLITADQLRRALADAGFAEVRMLGDYQGSDFDPAASSDLVVVARKP